MRRALCAFVLLAVSACESGTARSVKLTLPDGVVQSFSATAPGVVVSDLGARVFPYLVPAGRAPRTRCT